MKEIADLMEDICMQLPSTVFVLTIPGFGPYISARVLASIANPWRFDNSSQVLKLAGYDLVRAQRQKKRRCGSGHIEKRKR